MAGICLAFCRGAWLARNKCAGMGGSGASRGNRGMPTPQWRARGLAFPVGKFLGREVGNGSTRGNAMAAPADAKPTNKLKIAVIPGDGIGNEVVPEGIRVLEAVGARFGID